MHGGKGSIKNSFCHALILEVIKFGFIEKDEECGRMHYKCCFGGYG
jgi:hypothetical protein